MSANGTITQLGPSIIILRHVCLSCFKKDPSGCLSRSSSASRLLIGVVVALIAVKVVVSWLTGSLSVVAQAADSLLDLIAGIVTLLAIRMAATPADREHPV